jgi:hypothetical protein
MAALLASAAIAAFSRSGVGYGPQATESCLSGHDNIADIKAQRKMVA